MARCVVEWWGVLLVQVVLGGLWVVLYGFCWLRVISGGATSQHTEELTLYCTHERT